MMEGIANRSAPNARVVPVLVYEDVGQALDWLREVCGFSERLRAAGPDGVISHAQLTVGDGAIMIGRQGGDFSTPRGNQVSQYVLIRVEDLEAHFESARQHHATIVKPPANTPFGERQYTLLDPWGHRWTFSQTVADVAPETWGATVTRSKST